MNNYLVFMPGGEQKVEGRFPDSHQRISVDLWAIGSPLTTCVEVCNVLEIEEPNTMVVVPMTEYYGRFDRALWQKLESWSKT